MATSKPVFTLRMSEEILEKIKIIAERSKRSTSMQVEYAVEAFIKDYEKVNGAIKLTNNNNYYNFNERDGASRVAIEKSEYDANK